jgi:hypothetical protein
MCLKNFICVCGTFQNRWWWDVRDGWWWWDPGNRYDEGFCCAATIREIVWAEDAAEPHAGGCAGEFGLGGGCLGCLLGVDGSIIERYILVFREDLCEAK